MNQLYKNEIEKMMRSNSASIVEDIKKEGYGLMTGSMIVIALNKVPEILFEQLAPLASEFGATACICRQYGRSSGVCSCKYNPR